MKQLVNANKSTLLTLAGILLLVGVDTAFAGGLAWEKPICLIAASLSGPVAKAIAVIIFVLSGLAMAAGEASGIMKTLIMTVFGLSLAMMGAQWLGMLGAAPAGAGGVPGQTVNTACIW